MPSTMPGQRHAPKSCQDCHLSTIFEVHFASPNGLFADPAKVEDNFCYALQYQQYVHEHAPPHQHWCLPTVYPSVCLLTRNDVCCWTLNISLWNLSKCFHKHSVGYHQNLMSFNINLVKQCWVWHILLGRNGYLITVDYFSGYKEVDTLYTLIGYSH